MRKGLLLALALSLAWHLWLLGNLAGRRPLPEPVGRPLVLGLARPGPVASERPAAPERDPLLALAPGDALATLEAALPPAPPVKGRLYEPRMIPTREEVAALVPPVPEPAGAPVVAFRPELLEPLPAVELAEEGF